MKKILIACVNHNSYRELDKFLCSVDIAAEQVQDTCEVVVLVADNSTEKQNLESYYDYIQYHIHTVDNLGYLNSAQKVLEAHGEANLKTYDYCIISNVDIEVAADFFVQLLHMPMEEDVAWIAPRIYTPVTDADENPLAIHRYSKRKLQLLHVLYKYPFLHRIYVSTYHQLVKNKRKASSQGQKRQSIYAGHGSIFIFTQSFMQQAFPFDYPLFLYGEENYFGEVVRSKNMRTIYAPNIQVTNTSAHVSTGLIQHQKRCYYSQQAIEYILKTFY